MESESMQVENLGDEYVEEVVAAKPTPDTHLMASPSSFSTCSTDSIVSCRICKSTRGPDLIPSPCHCKGSMGTVHVSCLEEWLAGSTRESCELCSFSFKVVRTRKYGCLQSMWFFLRNRVILGKLFRDLVFLSVSTLNTSILFYMWFIYVLKDLFNIFEGKHSEVAMISNPLKEILYLFFFTLCVVFVTISAVDDFRRVFYYYFVPWYTWWQAAIDIKLVVSENERVITKTNQ